MSLLTAIGLTPVPPLTPIPHYGPAYLIFHFFFAYGVLSSRIPKQYYGIDHNLNRLRRNEAAHANAVENYALLVAAISLSSYAGVPRTTRNAAALTYTVARVCYGALYILFDRLRLSQLRGIAWWVGNFSCLTLLWKTSVLLNAA